MAWSWQPHRYYDVKERRDKYNNHLRSLDWHISRKHALEAANHQCVSCRTDKNLTVHHRTYENLGYENLQDLEVLCKYCHQTRHEDEYGWKERMLRRGGKLWTRPVSPSTLDDLE